jgi:2-polyprenyl-3-methyl-5-hydroxy-6-metoxy-1,4-benzoquinol methylase
MKLFGFPHIETLLSFMQKMSQQCLKQLCKGYKPQLPHFEAAVRHYLENSAASHPMFSTFLEYATSSLQRGEKAVKIIRRYTSIKRKKCLDVGCAYGGFPVAFALAGAASAVGVELNRNLLELAKELKKDVPCNAEFRNANILDLKLLRSLGTFDIITCNDVIEHVKDPYQLIERLALLLRPGGFLFMEIPNKYSLEAVLSDGHYGLFGITLLDRVSARRYHQQIFTDRYDIGEYLLLRQYIDALAQQDIDVQILNQFKNPKLITYNLRKGIKVLEREGKKRVQNIPLKEESTVRKLLQAIGHYITQFDIYDRACLNTSTTEEKDNLQRELLLHYHSYMWQLIAIKKSKNK